MKKPISKQSGEDLPKEHEAADYKVGYGRPPLITRFQTGRSGNPNGRPPRHKNLRTIVRNVAAERVTLREGDRTRKVSKSEAFVQSNFARALAKDARAAVMIIQLMRMAGMFDDDPADNAGQSLVSEQDTAIINSYLERLGLNSRRSSAGRRRRKARQ